MEELKQLLAKVLPAGSRRREIAKKVYRLARPTQGGIATAAGSYQDWIEQVEPTTLAPVPKKYTYNPLISIVVPAFNTPDKYLEPLLDSICAQTYSNWELVLVEASPDPERAEAIRAAAARDDRIRLIRVGQNKGIAGNTNIGLKEAKGEYIAFVDHDDTLASFALNEVIAVLQDRPEVDLFYSDEDKLSDDGRERSLPFFKPDWSLDLFLGVNYLAHFVVVRRTLAAKVKGIREGFEGAQDFDFLLRVLDHKPVIYHVPKMSYHWRMADGSTARAIEAKNYADDAGRRALAEYVQRNKVGAEVLEVSGRPTNYRLKYDTPGNPKASLIIPFKDKVSITKTMVDSVLAKTTYPNYEIILVDNRSEESATQAYLESLKDEPRIKVVAYDQPFNWSAVNNFGRRQASGEVLVFLNNDMEVQNADWLTELVGVALQPKVGAVGALLEYPNHTIQHAGVVLGFFGVAGHVFRGLTPETFTYFGLAAWPRNYLAVTGACIAVTAAKFDKLGQLDEHFITAGSDVAFGITAHEAGYRNVYWPFAQLTHYENVSVGKYGERDDNQHDYNESMKYYQPYLRHKDPFFNPNLDLYGPQAEQITLGDPSK